MVYCTMLVLATIVYVVTHWTASYLEAGSPLPVAQKQLA